MLSRSIRGIRTLGLALAAVLIVVPAMVLSPAAARADTTYHLSGTVTVLPGTTTIPGVSVTVSVASSGSPLASATTDQMGFYSVDVPADTYILEFTPPLGSAFKPATTQPTTVNADTTVDIGLVHTGLERLSGTITDAGGNPAAGLTLELSNSATTESSTTNAHGDYQIAVPDGTYDVTVVQSGGATGDLPNSFLDENGGGLVVSGDMTANYTLAADPVDVIVLGPDGTPVAGAAVSTNGDIFGGGASASLFGISLSNGFEADRNRISDNSGDARLWLFGGTNLQGTLQVTPPAGSGLAEANIPLPATINGNTTITVHLVPTRTLSGTITDAGGNPAAGLTLELSNSATTESSTTNAHGDYQIAVPDGTYDVTVVQSGGATGDLPNSFLDENGGGLVVSGDMTANYTLAADPVDVIVLGPDGTPVAGAAVSTNGDIFGGGASASLFGISLSNGFEADRNRISDNSGDARLWLFGGTNLQGTLQVTPPAGSGLAEANIPLPATINGNTTIVVSYAGGSASAISLEPTHLDFGSVDTSSQSTAQSINFTNVLGSAISVSSVTLAGADPSDFTVGNDKCSGASLGQGAGCTVNVTFAPGSGGARTATLQIADSGPGSPHTVTLSGTGVVTKASQSISFPATGVTYGQADFSPATASSGLPVSYSQPSGQCQVDSQGLVQITGAGSCTITASQSGNKDYQPAPPVTQTFTIAPATLSVDASPATEVYAGTPATLTYTLSGFVNGDTAATSNITGTASCSIAAGTGTDAGTYPGAITCAPGTLTAPNYTFTTGHSATLTINQASQTITFTTTPPASPVYGGSYTPAATATSRLPVAFSIDPSSTTGACQLSGGTVSFTGTGTCIIDASQPGDKDHLAAQPVTQAFPIAKATLAVDASPASEAFAGTPAALTYTLSGFVNGDTTATSNITGTASCSIAAGTGTDAGTYPGAITCAPGTLTAPNYTFTTGASAALTITQASQSVTFTTTPPASPVYGGGYTPAATATSGLHVAFSIDASSTAGACQLSGGTVSFTGTGTCVIDATQAGNTNYSSATAQQTLHIAKATLTVNADPASEVYAGTPATLTYTLSGFVNGDTAATSNITGTASCSIATGTGTNPGTYPGVITCAPGTLTAANYTFTTGQTATLTITQATQSVTFTTTPPASPVYGGSYTPAATATSGLPVAFSIDAASTSGACRLSGGTVSFTGTGTCIIDATQAGNANYSSATAQQTLRIAKKPLTVTADPHSKLFGAANPPLTATITGFAFGQTLQTSGVTGQPSCTTTATPSSPADTYPITCTQGTLAAANYSFTFTSGTLTITATKTITGNQAGPLTITAGQSVLIGPGATVTGPVTVQPGGALEVEGGTITGPLRSTGATGLRFCNATLTGPVTATGTSGLVAFGDDDGSVACAGNTINGPVSITGGTGGVEFDGNNVTGSLTITGNTGTLAPPDTGTVDATGNTVTGPINIQK
jgi:MBG domain-containing protein/carboxypeptidase family protein/centrosomal CEP192-like protein